MCVVLAIFNLIRVICCKFLEPWFWLNFVAMQRLCNTILERKNPYRKKSHTGENIADIILNFLQEKSIDIKYCRGQSYDNANNIRAFIPFTVPPQNCGKNK